MLGRTQQRLPLRWRCSPRTRSRFECCNTIRHHSGTFRRGDPGATVTTRAALEIFRGHSGHQGESERVLSPRRRARVWSGESRAGSSFPQDMGDGQGSGPVVSRSESSKFWANFRIFCDSRTWVYLHRLMFRANRLDYSSFRHTGQLLDVASQRSSGASLNQTSTQSHGNRTPFSPFPEPLARDRALCPHR